MSVTFLHAADLHLDTPFEGVSATHAALAERLRDASLSALDALIDHALQQSVDLVLLAGDLYDGAIRGVRAQLRLKRGLQRLSDAGIRAFLVHGNHDPVDEGWSAVRSDWPDGVHVFASDRAESIEVDVHGQRVVVHGTSYPRCAQPESLLPRFRPAQGPGLHIGLLHANVGQVSGHAAYSPCTVDELARLGMHYWALGHVHRAAVLRDEAPRVVYPGNTQGRSFKPSELGPKGCAHVTWDGATFTQSFVELAPIRFEEVGVDVSTTGDLTEVQRALAQAAEEVRLPGRGLIVRAVLRGRGPVFGDLQRAGTLAAMLDELRAQASPEVWWEALRDTTRPDVDLHAIRQRDDLAAAVLLAADELADPTAWLSERTELRGLVDTLDADTRATLLERATLRALHLLDDAEVA